jgi:hypothetical protein
MRGALAVDGSEMPERNPRCYQRSHGRACVWVRVSVCVALIVRKRICVSRRALRGAKGKGQAGRSSFGRSAVAVLVKARGLFRCSRVCQNVDF